MLHKKRSECVRQNLNLVFNYKEHIHYYGSLPSGNSLTFFQEREIFSVVLLSCEMLSCPLE
jgi:hypothetical protein